MTEALIADLAKIRSLRVVSRTSVMQFKDTRRPLRQIARELEADAIVEGSVLHAGSWVRITVQLIRADTDEHIWAESYQLEMRDVVVKQSEVARAVAQSTRRAGPRKKPICHRPGWSRPRPMTPISARGTCGIGRTVKIQRAIQYFRRSSLIAIWPWIPGPDAGRSLSPPRRSERFRLTADLGDRREWIAMSNQERTVKFMLIANATKDSEAGVPLDPRLMAAIAALSDESAKAGVLTSTGGLAPSSMGAKVRLSGGKVDVTDGPFAESKEVIGGYAIIDVGSKEEAIAFAKRFWQLHADVMGPSYEGGGEIRQLFFQAECGPRGE